MVSDDAFNSDGSVGQPGEGGGSNVGLSVDTYDEICVELRTNGPMSETPGPDEGERELRVARYDLAAARCGRWGDDQWR